MALVDYKVLVRVLAVNGASPVLRQIAADVLGLGVKVDAISAKFGKFNIALLGAGVGIGAIGAAAMRAELGLARMGDRLVQVQTRLSAMGASKGGISQIYNAAFAATQATPMIPMDEAFRIGQKMYGVFLNAREAAATTPMAVLADAVMKGAGLPGGPSALADVVKAGELTGRYISGGRFDIAAVKAWLDLSTRGLESAGGLLSTQQFRQSIRLAGPAARIIPPEELVPLIVEATQRMGPSAGRGLNMAFKEFMGGMIGRPYLMSLEQMGLVNQRSVRWFPGSSQGYIAQGGLLGQKEFISNPVGWVTDVLVPALRKTGALTTAQQIADVYRIFGRTTSGQLFADIIANPLPYQRTYGAIAQEKHIGAQYDIYRGQLSTSLGEASGALRTFFEVLGQPGVSLAVRQLHGLTSGIEGASRWLSAHPGYSKDINMALGIGGEGFAAVGVFTAMVGAARIILGVLGPWGVALTAVAAATIAVTKGFEFLDIWLKKTFPHIFPSGSNSLVDSRGHLKYPVLSPFGAAGANLHGIPSALVSHMVAAESGGNASAISSKGAVGLMQVMPGTLGFSKAQLLNPSTNVLAGTAYMQQLLSMFGGNYMEALAAYNWGPRNVRKDIAAHGALWEQFLPPATQSYVAGLAPWTPAWSLAATPPAPPSAGGGVPHVMATITNPADIGTAVSGGLATGLATNPSGSSQYNTRQSYLPPGRGSSLGVLVR
jgi:Transglycosylase SLT domain